MRTGCRRNVASPLARASPLSAGWGCDPPSSTLSSLSPSRRYFCRRPFPVSARRGPQTRPSTCSSSMPSLTSPSPPSARRRSWDRYGISCSSHLTSSSSSSSPCPPTGVDVTCLGWEQRRDAEHPLSQLNKRQERTPEDRGDLSSPSPPMLSVVPFSPHLHPSRDAPSQALQR